ncbi:hypothetical protein EBU24_04850 [bacterium]|nr:hypothetical protein [bacterium]
MKESINNLVETMIENGIEKHQIMLAIVHYLKESLNMSIEDAFNAVFGENKYQSIVNKVCNDLDNEDDQEEEDLDHYDMRKDVKGYIK